jgi:hypothetical protein
MPPCSTLPASLGPAPTKGNNIIEEAEQIFGEKVNITTEGKRHLGAVITYRIQRISRPVLPGSCQVVFGWGGSEIKNLGPLPFGGPLKIFFPETKKICRKILGRGEVPKMFSNTRFT